MLPVSSELYENDTVSPMNDIQEEIKQAQIRFARLFGFIRYERGIRQSDVAQRLDKHQSVVSLFESGERKLKDSELPRWADSIGVTLEDLEKLRMACYGYRWQNDGWMFWSDCGDPDDVEGEDPVDYYFGTQSDAVELIDRMVGRPVCQMGYYWSMDHHRDPADDDCIFGLNPSNDPGLSRRYDFKRPQNRLLGDPNDVDNTPELGTSQDLYILLGECTAEQIALTTAFIRGLHAQARSRIGTKPKKKK